MYGELDDRDLAEDYLALLRRGSVMRRLALGVHPAWRRAIRAKAGRDALRVRTWSRDGVPPTVWAVLPNWSLTPEEREKLARLLSWQQRDD